MNKKSVTKKKAGTPNKVEKVRKAAARLVNIGAKLRKGGQDGQTPQR